MHGWSDRKMLAVDGWRWPAGVPETQTRRPARRLSGLNYTLSRPGQEDTLLHPETVEQLRMQQRCTSLQLLTEACIAALVAP